MANDAQKSQRRPYTKKKAAVQAKQPEPVVRGGNKKGSSKSKANSSSKKKMTMPSIKSLVGSGTKQPKSSTRSRSHDPKGFIANHTRGLIVLVAILASLWIMYPAFRGYYSSKRNLEIYTAVADYLTTSNAELEAKISNLNSEEGIKELARDRGLVDEGEILINIQEPTKPEDEHQEGPDEHQADGQSDKNNENDNGLKTTPVSKGVLEKEKIQKISESIRDEASPLQKFLDFIFDYQPPNIKVL